MLLPWKLIRIYYLGLLALCAVTFLVVGIAMIIEKENVGGAVITFLFGIGLAALFVFLLRRMTMYKTSDPSRVTPEAMRKTARVATKDGGWGFLCGLVNLITFLAVALYATSVGIYRLLGGETNEGIALIVTGICVAAFCAFRLRKKTPHRIRHSLSLILESMKKTARASAESWGGSTYETTDSESVTPEATGKGDGSSGFEAPGSDSLLGFGGLLGLESDGEKSSREHSEGQKAGANADIGGLIAHHAGGKSVMSDAYNKGFEHGSANSPK